MKEESKIKSSLLDSHRIDWQMVSAIIIVSLIGIMTLWSGSIGFAIRNGGPNSIIAKQAILYVVSLICMAIAAAIPIKLLRAVLPIAVVLCVIGLSLPLFSPLGMTINKARRWIRIGSFSLQPSEIWKPVMVLYLASFLERRKERLVESGLIAFPAIILVKGNKSCSEIVS